MKSSIVGKDDEPLLLDESSDAYPKEGEEGDPWAEFPFLQKHRYKWASVIAGVVTVDSLRLLFTVVYLGNGMAQRWFFSGQMAMSVLDAYVPISVGYLSDRISSSWGKRKPFVFVGLMLNLVGIIGLFAGEGGSNSELGRKYITFNSLAYLGSNTWTTALTPLKIELCKDEAEYVRMVNLINYPVAVLTALVMTAAYFTSEVIALILACIGCFVALYTLVIHIHTPLDGQKTEPQPAILPALRAVWANPIARDLLIGLCICNFASGFGSSAVFPVIGFGIATYAKDIQLIIMGGFVLTLPSSMFILWYSEKKFRCGEWETYSTAVWALQYGAISSLVCFGLSCFAWETPLVFYPWFFISFALLGGIFTVLFVYVCVNIILRHACMLDTCVTKFNRFALFSSAITKPGDIVSVIGTSIGYIMLRSTGYEENDDDSLDDKVSQRYTWTPATIWYLRVVIQVVPAVLLTFAAWWFANFRVDGVIAKAMTEKASTDLERVALEQAEMRGTSDDNFRESLLGAKDVLAGRVESTGLALGIGAEGKGEEVGNRRLDSIDESNMIRKLTDPDAQRMMHFTNTENRAMARCDGGSARSLRFLSRFSLVNTVLGTASTILIVYFYGFCLSSGLHKYVDLITFSALICSLVLLREVLRFEPFRELLSFSDEEVQAKAADAVTVNRYMNVRLKTVLTLLGATAPRASRDSVDVDSNVDPQKAYKKSAVFVSAFFVLTALTFGGLTIAYS